MTAADPVTMWVCFAVVGFGLVIAHLPLRWIPGERRRSRP